jgi:hypothetical protein
MLLPNKSLSVLSTAESYLGDVDQVMAGLFEMHTASILQYLKEHGQQADWEIAAAMWIPLSKVRISLSDLSARGEISHCSVTRFFDGKPIEGMLCRAAGVIQPKAPGRKPGVKN